MYASSCFPVLSRHLLAHLGFQDIIPQADGAGEDASLAAHAETLQLTSPRSAPGTSPPQHMPEANGNAFKEEGSHPQMPCATRTGGMPFQCYRCAALHLSLKGMSSCLISGYTLASQGLLPVHMF